MSMRLSWGLPLTVLVAGCGPETSSDPAPDSDPLARASSVETISVDAASYEAWRPVYQDVRPAEMLDLKRLQERMRALTTWTAGIDALTAEIAVSPEHVRIRFGGANPAELEVHLTPSKDVMTHGRPVVVCFAAEPACLRVDGEVDPEGSPHPFGSFVDGALFTMIEVVGTQMRTLDLPLGETAHARVESPLGVLDCLVAGGTPRERAGLEGTPMDLSPELVVEEGQSPLVPFCVDARGLVIVTGNALFPAVPYTDIRLAVDDGIERYPAPVSAFGEPLPTPSPSETPRDVDSGSVVVLVAAAVIEPGETAEQVAQSGKISLESLPVDVVEPGAVQSVAKLEGVALTRLEPGDQLTTEVFGSP